MAVQFSADARRLIVAAATLAEARALASPRVRELADALASQGHDLPPFPVGALHADLEILLADAAARAGSAEVTVDSLLTALGAMGPDASPTPSAQNGPRTSQAVKVAISRVGIGYDSHRFTAGGPMLLAGVRIPSDVRCSGHSDGDAVCHALTDAVLGAAGAGDIGEMFPDTDPANAGRDSIDMLTAAVARVRERGFVVVNADVTVIAEQPKIGPHRSAMRDALSVALGVDASMVAIKGKTNEGMGWIGRGEGLAVIAVAGIAVARS